MRRFGIWAGCALLFSGLSALVAAASQTTAIGGLTFHYDAAFWRMERADGGLVATCLHEDCRGAIIDISRHDDETGCTKAAMAAEAARRFPDAGRHYANVRPAGRFALVLAQRHAGRALSSPEFAFGCVRWQGSAYQFAMRPQSVGTQSWIGSALQHLVSTATAPEAIVEQVRIGAVDFHVSTEVWRIAARADGTGLLLHCRAPTCREDAQGASITVRAPARTCPGAIGGLERELGHNTRAVEVPADAPGGLAFTLVETYLGCRNYVPPRVEACAVHGDKSYHLSTIGVAGCRQSVWAVPQEELIRLLNSARIAR